MKVQENSNYTVILNQNDMLKLLDKHLLNFWVVIDEDNELNFTIKKE